jgi:integration host factor subunit alpha
VRAPRTTTKTLLAQRVYATVDAFTKRESAAAVDLLFALLKETAARGETIKIVRFGNFTLLNKRARPGRNPQSGTPTEIAARRVVTFKISRHLKRTLNPSARIVPAE